MFLNETKRDDANRDFERVEEQRVESGHRPVAVGANSTITTELERTIADKSCS